MSLRTKMVLPVRIELTTSALPRMRSTTELRQHINRAKSLSTRANRGAPMDKAYGRVKAKRAIVSQLWQNRMMNASNAWQKRCAPICVGASLGTKQSNRRNRKPLSFAQTKDQTATLILVRRRSDDPISPNPTISIAQLSGSGTCASCPRNSPPVKRVV
jgi:hypothetical protein